MILLIVFMLFGIDIYVHYLTIHSWGWLDTILVNLLLMLIGCLLYQWRKSSVDWKKWTKSHNSYSKKALKKLEHQAKHNPENISIECKVYMATSAFITTITIGYVLVMLPGLITGGFGLVMMVIGFYFVIKYQQT